MRQLKILFTARDPGGAGAILPVFQYFRERGECEVVIAASGIAHDWLCKQGEQPFSFFCSSNRDYICHNEDPTQLLEAADELLGNIQPDAVVTALSSFGAGIDEAVIAQAVVPTFSIQDCWGDVNTELGVTADTYFVIDDFAAKLSQDRFGVNTVVVGAPKYTRYSTLDIPSLRHQYRHLAGIADGVSMVCWFGQSPKIPGHEKVFEDFISVLPELRKNIKVVLRGHPKFAEDFALYLNQIRLAGLDVCDATGKGRAEGWLSACDLMVTPFSMSGIDHAYLTSVSPEVLGNVVYLMTNKDIQDFQFQATGIRKFPPLLNRGIGYYVDNIIKIDTVLNLALTWESRIDYYHRSKQLIFLNPCVAIYKYILECLRKE
ncbi:hypothetical protein POG22_01465 [Geitlerinema sp. CS-897]|nr:hypothetical protein [Geitlerinema sp. CS-897]